MESIDPAFFRDVRLEVGEVGFRHPVVLRVTPWSVTLVKNPCAEFPVPLSFLSNCDCASRLSNLILRSEDLLQRWASGDSRNSLSHIGKRMSIPAEIGTAVEAFLTLAEDAQARDFDSADQDPQDGSSEPGEATDEPRAGDRGRGKPAGGKPAGGRGRKGQPADPSPLALDFLVPPDRCMTYEHLLDSEDQGLVWYALQGLKRAEYDQVHEVLQPRLQRASLWPLCLRLKALAIADRNPWMRGRVDHMDLLAAVMADPAVSPVVRRRLLNGMPVHRTEIACRILLVAAKVPDSLSPRDIGEVLNRILRFYDARLRDAKTREAVVRLVVELLGRADSVARHIEHHAPRLVDDLVSYLESEWTSTDGWCIALQLLSRAPSFQGGLDILRLIGTAIDKPARVGFGLQMLNGMGWDLAEQSKRTFDFLFAASALLDHILARSAEGYGPFFRSKAKMRNEMTRLSTRIISSVMRVIPRWDPNKTFEWLLARMESDLSKSEKDLVFKWGSEILNSSSCPLHPALLLRIADSSIWDLAVPDELFSSLRPDGGA